MLKWSSLLLGLIGGLMALFLMIRNHPHSLPLRPINEPASSPFSFHIGALGIVESKTSNTPLNVPLSGTIAELYVQVGDQVEKGTPLAKLDTVSLQAQLAIKEAALALAQAKYEKCILPPREEELMPLHAYLHAAQARLEGALLQLNLLEKIPDSRAIRQEDLQKSKVAVRQAEAEVEAAEAQLSLIKSGTAKADIHIALQAEAGSTKQKKILFHYPSPLLGPYSDSTVECVSVDGVLDIVSMNISSC